jgi:hypothetical protein
VRAELDTLGLQVSTVKCTDCRSMSEFRSTYPIIMDRKNLHNALGRTAPGAIVFVSTWFRKKSKHVHCFTGSEVSDMSSSNVYMYVLKQFLITSESRLYLLSEPLLMVQNNLIVGMQHILSYENKCVLFPSI